MNDWKTQSNEDFNSHAHVERDYEEKQSGVTISISTHTLTWSVTIEGCVIKLMLKHFNSHAHVERD